MKFFKEHSKDIVFAGVILICLLLVGFSLMIVKRYSGVLEDQVATRVESYAMKADTLITNRLEPYKENAVYAAGKIQDHTEREDFLNTMSSLSSDTRLYGAKGLLYRSGDGFYKETSEEWTYEVPAAITEMIARAGGSSEVYRDPESNMNMIAFGSPVKHNDNVDFVILYYPQELLNTVVTDARLDESLQKELDMAELVVLTSADGEILETVYDKNDLVKSRGNIADILSKRVDDADVSSRLAVALGSGENGSVETSVNRIPYAIGIARSDSSYGLYVISLYRASDAYQLGYVFISLIITTVIILFVIMICYTVYFIVSRRKVAKMMREFGTKDPKLGCPTMLGFERMAPGLVRQYPGSKFAVVLAEVKHFSYLRETYGQSVADETLSFVYRTFKKALGQAEIIGFLGENEFVLLLHYKDNAILANRLRIISTGISETLGARKYNVKLIFGVSEVERTKDDTYDMRKYVSSCTMAKNSATENTVGNNVIFFNDVFRETYMQHADVEIKMDAALNAGEFKVFFQPKVNLHTNHCDGCEALVRWYDSQNDYYRPPDTFLPLFEENGFIVKLDKYIFYQVCRFVHDRVDAGLRVYPVSVNISRLTALAPDFLDYYSSVKKKFRIADNFIMLEFTESIAHESYKTLNHIAQMLHKVGFHCSIDDFGLGYSSFNILKNMEMDEIKLDKIFIEKGLSDERDRAIWESVISLGRALQLKVTQEGVETEELMTYLRKVGCDVVQGYYYSAPLPMDEFQRFLEKCAEEEETSS